MRTQSGLIAGPKRRDDKRCQQQHVTLVTVVGKGRYRNAGWHGPFEGTGVEARRQIPAHSRGRTRITRVAPVGMPLRGMVQSHGKPGAPTGDERTLLGNEFDLELVGAYRIRAHALHARKKTDQGCQEEDPHAIAPNKTPVPRSRPARAKILRRTHQAVPTDRARWPCSR